MTITKDGAQCLMNESFYIVKSDTNFHPLSWISQIIIKTRFSILHITRQDVKYLKVDETIRIQKKYLETEGFINTRNYLWGNYPSPSGIALRNSQRNL